MALQTSGAISLNDIHIEAGGSSGTTCSMNDPDIRGLTAAAGRTINSTQNGNTDFADYYGATAEVALPTSGSTINGQAQLKQISASTYISSGGTLSIPSNMWVWSDDRTVAALTVDIPCTIINRGKVIGKGGQGGCGLALKNTPHPTASTYRAGYSTANLGTGHDGGPAINVTSSGVTIVNASGAYIAGGGGGGGSSGVEPQNSGSGGGGGAGGAEGGFPFGPAWQNSDQGSGWPNYTTNGPNYSTFGIYGTDNSNVPRIGFGGALNERGFRFTQSNYQWSKSYGGQAGGAGNRSADEDSVSSGGDGSGRILPGTRYTPSYSGSTYGGAGGEAGQNGGAGGNTGSSGGGGGWGAAGGRGYRGAFTSVQCQGGNAGAAITGTSRTLSNSGTIYGGT